MHRVYIVKERTFNRECRLECSKITQNIAPTNRHILKQPHTSQKKISDHTLSFHDYVTIIPFI